MSSFKKLAALLLAAAMLFAALPSFAVKEKAASPLTEAERIERISSLAEFNTRFAEMKRVYGRRAEESEGAYALARIIVKSASRIDTAGAVACVGGYNDWYVLQYSTPEEAKLACSRYSKLSTVEYAVPDIIMKVDSEPAAAPYKSWGYGESHVNAREFNDWLLTQAGSVSALPEVIVGVIDTGADQSHPFLAGRLVQGYDVADDDYDPDDGHSHGTHVSGTVVDGTLENVKVMPIKVLGDNGFGTTLDVALGIEYGYLHGCRVENLSLGGDCDGLDGREHLLLAEAIESAFENGTIVCVAAGNESEDASYHCPANVRRACTVAAIEQDHSLCYFSNFGDYVDVAAPGANINSSVPGGGFGTKSGTSMACPHVSAVAAMIASANPTISADDAVNVIKNTAVGIGLTNAGTGMAHVCADIFGFDSLVNAAGHDLHFASTGNYGWQADDGCISSTNAGVNNSTASVTCKADVGPDQTVTFEYKVSSEQDHDHFRLRADGTVLFEASGEQGWQSVTVDIPGSGCKQLTWEFHKDASSSSGSDKAWLRGVSIGSSLNTAVNFTGIEIPFTSTGAYPWYPDDSEHAAASGNAGVNGSESVMETTVQLSKGMKVEFKYKVSAGSGDMLTVTDNGRAILTSSNTNGFVKFEYTVPERGEHNFRFVYSKDGSGSSGSDRAWVKQFCYYHTFESSVNGKDDFLPFDNTCEYPWMASGEAVCSTNFSQDSTESYFTLTLPMQAGETLTFRYKPSSETNYDFFRFYVDGVKKIESSGNRTWQTYTFTAVETKSYFFKWSFEKDYMAESYDDCAYVDDVTYSGTYISADGDANGNGTVDSVDALLILRYAMGLIDETQLQLDRCDVNGDGVVDSADALLILRRTLGM